jgi:PilZ domain
MENSGREEKTTTELRRHPRLRVPVPFACSFARIGLQRWLAAERAGLGVVLYVPLNGARVMSLASMNPGDQLAISLRLPDQTTTMNVDATVRWGNRHTVGLEFTAVSQLAETRLRKFLSRASSSQA